MALQQIDINTPQPNGKFGESTRSTNIKINANTAEIGQRLEALEGGSAGVGERLDEEVTARAAADLALGARLDGEAEARVAADSQLAASVDEAAAAAAAADSKAATAQETANAKASKSGDTFTGPTRINASLKVQAAEGSSILRAIGDGGGGTTLQSVVADESAFAALSFRGSNVFFTGNSVRLDTSQLYVVGPAIPSGQYAGYILLNLEARPGNNADKVAVQYYRSSGTAGASWSDFTWRWGRTVDATQQQFLEFQPNGDIFFQCGTGTGGNVRFSSTGVLTASGGVSGGGSDPRIKDAESLRPIQNATEALLGLNTRIGRYLEGFGDGGKSDRAFVMADDAMRENTPEVILENIIDGRYAGWATEQLIAYLVAAHREGLAREESLGAMVEALAARVSALEAGA